MDNTQSTSAKHIQKLDNLSIQDDDMQQFEQNNMKLEQQQSEINLKEGIQENIIIQDHSQLRNLFQEVASKLKLEFNIQFKFEFEGMESIDEIKKVFISYNDLQGIITEVVNPVMLKISNCLQQVHNQEDKFKDIHFILRNQDKDLQILKKGFRQFEEINKNIQKLEIDLRIIKENLQTTDRNAQLLTDSIKTQFEMVLRSFDIERQKMSDFKDHLRKQDDVLFKFKQQQIEVHNMHQEEILQNIEKVCQVIKNEKEVVKKQVELNNFLRDKLESQGIQIEQIKRKSVEFQWELTELNLKKLDIKINQKQINGLNGDILNFKNRLNQDSDQNSRLCEFILKYYPLYTQIQITENLNACLDSRSLQKHQDDVMKRVELFKKNIKERIFPINHIEESRKEIMKNIFQVAGSVISRLRQERLYDANQNKQKLKYEEQNRESIVQQIYARVDRQLNDLESQINNKQKGQFNKVEQNLGVLEKKFDRKIKKIRNMGKQSSNHLGASSNKEQDMTAQIKQINQRKNGQSDSDKNSEISVQDIIKLNVKDLKKDKKVKQNNNEQQKQINVKNKKENKEKKISQKHETNENKEKNNTFDFKDQPNSTEEKQKIEMKELKDKRKSQNINEQDNLQINQNHQNLKTQNSRKDYSDNFSDKQSVLKWHESVKDKKILASSGSQNSSISSFDDQSEDDDIIFSKTKKIDLSNYYKKDETESLIKSILDEEISKVKNKQRNFLDKIQLQMDMNLQRLMQVELVARSSDEMLKETKKEVFQNQENIQTQLELILKTNQREKSDLQLKIQKQFDIIQQADKKISKMFDSLHSISTTVICLIECTCMQIRAEEQDDQDKQSIQLMGSTNKILSQDNQIQNTKIYQQSQFQDQDEQNNRRQQSYETKNLLKNDHSQLQQQSPKVNTPMQLQDFPQVIEIKKKKIKLNDIKKIEEFKDEGNYISPAAQQLKFKMPKKKGILSIDPICLSCSANQSDIIKNFKIACLSYKPSSVVFRNIEFKREQLRIFQKFLMGQCAKLIHSQEPFTGFGMSTKKVFDDMYLYLKKVNQNNLEKNSQESKLDYSNGLPEESYYEITSKFWNLIYKEPYSQKNLEHQYKQNLKTTKNLSLTGLDDEFAGGITNPFSFEFSNLTSVLGGPLSEAQTKLQFVNSNLKEQKSKVNVKILGNDQSSIEGLMDKKNKKRIIQNDSIDSLSDHSVLNIKEIQPSKYLNPISEWNTNSNQYNNSAQSSPLNFQKVKQLDKNKLSSTRKFQQRIKNYNLQNPNIQEMHKKIQSVPNSPRNLNHYEKQTQEAVFNKATVISDTSQINQNSGGQIKIITFKPNFAQVSRKAVKTPIIPNNIQIGFEIEQSKSQNSKRIIFKNNKLSQQLNNWNILQNSSIQSSTQSFMPSFNNQA